MSKAQGDIGRKLKVLRHGEKRGNVAKTCRQFGIVRQAFYNWKCQYEKPRHEGLINHKPCPENPRLRVAAEIQEKILHLITLGPERFC